MRTFRTGTRLLACALIIALTSLALQAEQPAGSISLAQTEAPAEPAPAEADSVTESPASTETGSHSTPAEAAGTGHGPKDHGEDHAADSSHDAHPNMGKELGLWTLIPFGGILLSIAVFPLIAGHWWEHNSNRAIVAAVFAVPMAVYLVAAWGEAGLHDLMHKGVEYVSFIVLLTSLFVITGGVYVKGSLSGTPLVNTGIMALGAVLANAIGTTGASVLLIRPLLRANAPRTKKVHIVVFFIFIVSNCGGLLTPLGDPPLFLGFLKGVPFEWTLSLWKQWLMVNIILLVIFNIWDQVVLNKEEKERAGSQLEQVQEHAPLEIHGRLNFLFLAGVVATIVFSGSLGFGVTEAIMAALAAAAYITTPKANRESNRFSFAPIAEVAILFAGIFVTMSPALLILNAWGQGERDVFGIAFGLDQNWQFFWATGILSSFLDNAPTYLTFAATACGMEGIALDGAYLAKFVGMGEQAVKLLAAISCGAVFMGANTYIGNGPNFMVKAIAEENGVKMPTFFGYMLYSFGILVPVLVVVTFVFFR